MDSKNRRDGITLDEVGTYRPVEPANQVQLKVEKIQDWLQKGALVTPTVKSILNRNNILLK